MTKKLEEMSLEELEAVDASKDEPTEDIQPKETVDTDVETPEEDVQTAEPSEVDTVPETPDYDELFKQSGLDKQYPGGIKEMLSRLPDTNRYLRELQEERKALKEQNEKYQQYLLDKNKPDTPEEERDFLEELSTDPDGAIKRRGFIDSSKFQETEQRLGEVEKNLMYNKVANIVDGYEEIRDVAKKFRTLEVPERGQNAIWDRFVDLTEQYGLEVVPLDKRLALLYDQAKSDVMPDKTKPPVKPLSATQKAAAQTTKPKTSTEEAVDYNNMSADEVYKHAQEHGRVDY